MSAVGPAEEYAECFRTLDLPVGASSQEVKASYEHLRALYSRSTIVTNALLEQDVSEERREAILEGIERAYASLMERFEALGRATSARDTGTEASSGELFREFQGTEDYSGDALRRIRERLGVPLEAVERATKIQRKYIQYVEDENFEALPEEVFVRGYVAAYARFLSLEPEKVVARYIARYQAGRKK